MSYKAFVSSTFEDLQRHRRVVIAALRKAGLFVDPMEDWTASSDEPKRFSQDRLENCDLCVLLVGFRRGHVPVGELLSITQLEYKAALALGIDVLVFMLREDAPWPRQFDELDKDPGIRRWRDELKESRGIGFFGHEPNSIEIAPALTRWVAEKQRSTGLAKGLDVSTLDDAIRRHLTTLRARIEERRTSQRRNVQRNILDLYVEPLGASEPPPVTAHASTNLPPHDPHVLTWQIGGPSPPAPAVTSATTPADLWSLLRPHLESGKPCALIADFGTGKSWFLEMTQYRAAGDRLAGKGWVPLLVSLRNFHLTPPSPGLGTMLAALLGGVPKASSPLEQIREQAWTAAFGESLAPAQLKDLLRLYEEGQFLFLLDALDEMGSGARDEARVLLSDVGRLAAHTRRSPVVLTVRRSFFRDAADEERLKDDGFEVFYLWPWSPEAQLRAYLDRAAAIGLLRVVPSDVLKSIEATYDLVDLAQRALLAAMLVDQWTDLASSRSVDLPTLYGRHVEKALLQWQGKKARTLTMAEVKRLMAEIAFLMFRLDSLVLSAEEMDQYFGKVLARRGVEKYSEVAESLVRDIETNSLLVRDKDGFAFCHLSLWEFLVAERLRSALLGAEDSLFSVLQRSRRYESIMKHFLVTMLLTDGQYVLLERLFQAGPSHNSPPFGSTG
jgi:hypothetical protein